MRRHLLVVMATLVLVGPLAPWAQAGSGLGVSPVRLDYELQPGEEVTKALMVYNSGDVALRVTTEMNDYKVNEQGSATLSEPPPEAASASRWLSVEPDTLHLAPGAREQVTLRAVAPDGAEPGGHYAVALFRFRSAEQGTDGGVQVGISGRVGVVNMITIPGDIIKQGALQSISVPFLRAGYPIPVKLAFTNSGNTHLNTSGTLEIVNRWGNKEPITMKIPVKYVFPDSSRTLELTMNSGAPIGIYTATVKLDEEAIAPITKPVTFIVFPWTMALGVILVTAAIFILGMRQGRKAAPPAQTTGADS